MRDVTQIVAQLREELAGELRERVRRRLREQPADWLVDQLMALVLPPEEVSYAIPRQVPRGPEADAHAAVPLPEAHGCAPWNGEPLDPVTSPEAEGDRPARIRRLGLDATSLPGFTARYRSLRREVLEAEGYLLDPPPRGGALIAPAHRSPEAEALLREAKDVLHALLFCGPQDGVRLDRAAWASLTLAVPPSKAHAVAALLGPEARAEGSTFRVEFGELPGEPAHHADETAPARPGAAGLVAHALGAALCLINDLEINEPTLCGR
ncbi:hypothetical protein Skr01_33580 [Sphaerisporangium krabiense]|uniref:Uncharacterized protein n=1 Tax=Sphaerisporangium krabiense TaxID=763782 RepID=A0A7W8Z2P8_9ACTN|nr:hypothetical protein [Sphaerisporangium krabiense]MBB5626358.1 hypothetical protein [Sphaerisporangium krabiense]GII63273.1 hypothetical protein Skr01_33580 [Sphaerisporangium krabiense]